MQAKRGGACMCRVKGGRGSSAVRSERRGWCVPCAKVGVTTLNGKRSS